MITSSVAMIATVLICFVAAVLNLALESRFRLRMTRIALIMTIAIGIFFYGYGYGWCMGYRFTALIRAMLALCKMFGGFNDLASIQDAPLFRNRILLAVFWLMLNFLLLVYDYLITALQNLYQRKFRKRIKKIFRH